MAEVPEAYFPEALRLEVIPKEEFSNFGSYGGVHISGPARPDMVFQYNHHGKERNLSLSAVAPTLPLSDTPAKVVNVFGDRVMQRLQHQAKVGTALLKKLSRGKGLNNTKRCRYFEESLWEFREWLEHHYVEVLPEGARYPHWFTSLDEMVQQLPPSGYVPKVNTKFYGGCVSAFKTSEGLGLMHASGTSLDKLSMVSVSGSSEQEGGDRLLREKSVSTVDAGFPVCQIHTQAVKQNVMACVRTEASCSMYSINWNDDSKAWHAALLDTQNANGEIVTSVSVSPYIPGESLIVTDVGSMYIWKAGKSLQKVVELEAPRFRCLETWRHCHYGAHPRQVLLTDQTCMQLFDYRQSLVWRGGLDIFSLPDSRLKPLERISASAHLPAWPYYHLVATDHWLFVMDQRFPKSSVLQWAHMLEQAPQYLWAGDYLPGQALALVGCQLHPEVTAFHFQHQAGSPVTSDLQPWRLSPIREFSQLGNQDGGSSRLVQQRLQTSLAGMAACPGLEDGTLATFQMDSLGEVYHQVYGPKNVHTRDKTGRKSDCSLWQERAKYWLQTVEQQVMTLQSQHLGNLRKFSQLQHQDAAAKQLPGQCALCHERLEEGMDMTFDLVEALTGPMRISPEEDEDRGLSICNRCQEKTPRRSQQLPQWDLPTLAEEDMVDTEQPEVAGDPGLRLQQVAEEDVALQKQLIDEEDYLTSSAAQEDFNSQIIYLQYVEDERFQQLVPLRAERLQKQKKEYIETAWKEHAKKMSKDVKDGQQEEDFFLEGLPDLVSMEKDVSLEREASMDGDGDMEIEQCSDRDAERRRDTDSDNENERGSRASVNVELLAERLLEYERAYAQGSRDNESERSPSLF